MELETVGHRQHLHILTDQGAAVPGGVVEGTRFLAGGRHSGPWQLWEPLQEQGVAGNSQTSPPQPEEELLFKMRAGGGARLCRQLGRTEPLRRLTRD